jgi:hypothetical protein
MHSSRELATVEVGNPEFHLRRFDSAPAVQTTKAPTSSIISRLYYLTGLNSFFLSLARFRFWRLVVCRR